MKYDILTIGDSFEDIFVEPEEVRIRNDMSFGSNRGICFELGDKIPLSSVEYEIGGSACNAAVGFSRLGYKAALLSVVGSDSPAKKILEKLGEEGVIRSNMMVLKDSKSNFSTIFRFKEDRTIFVYHMLKDYRKFRLLDDLETKWFFLGPIGENTDGLENDLINFVCEKGSRLAWNPGSIQVREGVNRYRHLLKVCDILFLNREESIKFLRTPVRLTDKEILKRLFGYGPKVVVVTNGVSGLMVYNGINFFSSSIVKNPQPKDTTGAGDSFAVGFVGSIMKEEGAKFTEEDISSAIKWGLINSSSVIGFVGAQKGLLKRSTIIRKTNSLKPGVAVE